MTLVRRVFGGFLVAACLGGAACDTAPPATLAHTPSATFVVTDPPSAAGDPFEVLLFVRMPAGARLHELVLPELDGIDVVDERTLPPMIDGSSALHRVALLARTRNAGTSDWPRTLITVIDSDGKPLEIEADGFTVDVPSVFGEGAPPRRPRGYRATPVENREEPLALGFAVGVGTTAAFFLLIGRLRRRKSDQAVITGRDGSKRENLIQGGAHALSADVDAAAAVLDLDAVHAAAQASAALRRWAAHRFVTPTHAHSSEELLRMPPEGVAHGDWREWVELLAALDRDRFGPARGERRRRNIESHIQDVQRFAAAQGGRGRAGS